MSRICQVTGKRALVGNNVSHSNKKTKRKFEINLVKKRFFIPEENNQWREEIIDLTDFLDEEIMLKFVTTNLRGNNIIIDNINIYDSENSTPLIENKLNVSVHPNPSNGIFELSFNNHYIKNISVYNNNSQLIMNKLHFEKHMNRHELNLEKNQAGLYFVTIETKNEKITIKILKHD